MFCFYGLVFITLCVFINQSDVVATPITGCRGVPADKTMVVNIKDCTKPPCLLKKRTNVTIEIQFVASKEISTLKTGVHALLGGLPLPFIGVDGKDACKDIHEVENPSQVGCPLKPGTKYLYSNTFYIQPLYPNVSPKVHWSLLNGRTNVVCFEVPVKISY